MKSNLVGHILKYRIASELYPDQTTHQLAETMNCAERTVRNAKYEFLFNFPYDLIKNESVLKLSASAVTLLHYLQNVNFKTQKEMSEHTGMDSRVISKCLKELRESGVLEIQ